VHASLLLVALAVFAIAIHIAAGPGGVALREPAAAARDPSGADPSTASTQAATGLHLVLVVDDPDLARALDRRLAAATLVGGEYGAPSHPATFEVITVTPGDPLHALDLGLREYQAGCIAASCPAITVLDLRRAPPE
jgi:hypothetical protein